MNNDLVQLVESWILLSPWVRVLLAAAVFLLFWLLKRPLTQMLGRLLYKILNHRKAWLSQEQLSSALVPCHSIIALLGVSFALRILGLGSRPWAVHGLRIAVIALVTWILLRFWEACSPLILSANRKLSQELNLPMGKTLSAMLDTVVKALILVLAALTILTEVGVNVTALITGLGLGGLTFALAAQDTASNLFSGLVILLDKPFSVEDWIQTPDLEGVVEDITFRSTRIRTFANAQVVVPNSTLTSKPITNWSRMEKRRVSFSLGLTYGSSSAQLQRCVSRIKAMLEQHPGVVEGSAVVNFDGFGDSSLNISVLYFSKDTSYAGCQQVKEDVNLKLMAIIEEEGCSFAFPSRTVYLEK